MTAMTAPGTFAASGVLARARRHRAEADAAEAQVLADAVAWALAHEIREGDGAAATWGDTPVILAGEGTPAVSEFCVAELAAALGMTTDAGRALVAEALELACRLPRTYARVQDGTVQAWKARRIAARTMGLPPEAVAYIDVQVAGFAHRIRGAALDRLIDTAIERYLPEVAEAQADVIPDPRKVEIHHDDGLSGLSYVEATLDLRDALDLEHRLQAGAARLADLGSTDCSDVRRSIALGALARGDQELGLDAGPVVLHVHLDPDADLAVLEQAGTHLLSAEQVRLWCRTAATIIVKPVIDLSETLHTDTYAIPDPIREHVVLRDRACIFPWCERNARRCDLDHVREFDRGGATSTDNLAPLCRRHHRLKTFGEWAYLMLEPGVYLWTSPHGYRFVRDGTGTRDLTARPVEPPGAHVLLTHT